MICCFSTICELGHHITLLRSVLFLLCGYLAPLSRPILITDVSGEIVRYKIVCVVNLTHLFALYTHWPPRFDYCHKNCEKKIPLFEAYSGSRRAKSSQSIHSLATKIWLLLHCLKLAIAEQLVRTKYLCLKPALVLEEPEAANQSTEPPTTQISWKEHLVTEPYFFFFFKWIMWKK